MISPRTQGTIMGYAAVLIILFAELVGLALLTWLMVVWGEYIYLKGLPKIIASEQCFWAIFQWFLFSCVALFLFCLIDKFICGYLRAINGNLKSETEKPNWKTIAAIVVAVVTLLSFIKNCKTIDESKIGDTATKSATANCS
jgi:hypothetical protein